MNGPHFEEFGVSVAPLASRPVFPRNLERLPLPVKPRHTCGEENIVVRGSSSRARIWSRCPDRPRVGCDLNFEKTQKTNKTKWLRCNVRGCMFVPQKHGQSGPPEPPWYRPWDYIRFFFIKTANNFYVSTHGKSHRVMNVFFLLRLLSNCWMTSESATCTQALKSSKRSH